MFTLMTWLVWIMTWLVHYMPTQLEKQTKLNDNYTLSTFPFIFSLISYINQKIFSQCSIKRLLHEHAPLVPHWCLTVVTTVAHLISCFNSSLAVTLSAPTETQLLNQMSVVNATICISVSEFYSFLFIRLRIETVWLLCSYYGRSYHHFLLPLWTRPRYIIITIIPFQSPH